jgi:hypothetical protein
MNDAEKINLSSNVWPLYLHVLYQAREPPLQFFQPKFHKEMMHPKHYTTINPILLPDMENYRTNSIVGVNRLIVA